jgi:hypothetical protein
VVIKNSVSDPDTDSGGLKRPFKTNYEIFCNEVLDVLFLGLKGFCRLVVHYEGQGISK